MHLLEELEGVVWLPRTVPTASTKPHDPFGFLKPRDATPVVRMSEDG